MTGVFGRQGELRLFLYNPGSDLLADERRLTLASPTGARREVWLSTRPGAGRRVLGRIRGVDSPEAAEILVGAELLLARADLPKTDPDTWYHFEIIGLPVKTASGRDLGRVAEIYASGDVDIWVVRGGDEESYIRALKANLVSVDVQSCVVVADHAAEAPV